MNENTEATHRITLHQILLLRSFFSSDSKGRVHSLPPFFLFLATLFPLTIPLNFRCGAVHQHTRRTVAALGYHFPTVASTRSCWILRFRRLPPTFLADGSISANNKPSTRTFTLHQPSNHSSVSLFTPLCLFSCLSRPTRENIHQSFASFVFLSSCKRFPVSYKYGTFNDAIHASRRRASNTLTCTRSRHELSLLTTREGLRVYVDRA